MAAAAAVVAEGDCEDLGGSLIWWLWSLEARVAELSKWKATLLSGLDGGVSSERSRGLRSQEGIFIDEDGDAEGSISRPSPYLGLPRLLTGTPAITMSGLPPRSVHQREND